MITFLEVTGLAAAMLAAAVVTALGAIAAILGLSALLCPPDDRAPFLLRLRASLGEYLGIPPHVPADGDPLSEDELKVFTGYAAAEERGLPLADEPQRRQS